MGATLVVVALAAARAGAATPTVSIPPGPFHDQQTITVTGTGFPNHSQLPTGLQIIECSDPGGLAANLPTDAASGCEGITVNPIQISTDNEGRFQASYQILALNAQISSIMCDATNLCVLWVGQDYNNAFTEGPHAFSAPFGVVLASGASPTATSPTPAVSTPTPAPTPTTPSAENPSVAPSGSAGATVDQASTLATTGPPTRTLAIAAIGALFMLLGVAGRAVVGRRAVVDRTWPCETP